MNPPDIASLQAACDALLGSQQSLLMATRSPQGEAEISYAPFVRHDGQFYIFISQLARHTQNLQAHPHLSVMLIEPEQQATNPFARQRLTLRCVAEKIGRDDGDFPARMAQLKAKFGETVALLESLPDFHLLALTPLDGLFVAGFGKALPVDGNCRLTGSPKQV